MRAPRVLVLYWNPKGMEMRHAVRRHLHALDGPDTEVLYHNAIDPAPPWVVWTSPDLCLLHTTFLCARWFDNFETFRRRFLWISALDCPKVALPQDEYDHAGVLEEWLLELGATSVYSCFGSEHQSILYPRLGERALFQETLTGYIDGQTAERIRSRTTPHSRRSWDIVYRATRLPYWFGSHGQLKHRIAELVQEKAAEFGFETDISTRYEDTIYGGQWLDFMMSGRAVIGSESGSSVLDPRGDIQRRIRTLLAEQPELTFAELNAFMPPGWDSYSFFAISPRHLEAVITKTAQVLVEGSYSGILEPERHYIPLRRDFSNLDEALDRLRDVEAVEEMADRAYREVYLEGRNTLEAFGEQLRREPGRPARPVGFPFTLAKRLPVPGLPAPLARRGRLIPLVLTLIDGLAREPEARSLLLRTAGGRSSLPLSDVLRDIVLLRVLGRVRRDGGREGEPWSLSATNDEGTIVIRTHRGPRGVSELRLEGPFESVVWNHAAVAQAVPLFPRRPRWGWIAVGPNGRYEFKTLETGAGGDRATTRALLDRVLGS